MSDQVSLTVRLTVAEVSAVSAVAVIVTSAVGRTTVRAAESAFRKVREAARKHCH